MKTDVADFAELGDFIDLPVRTYSSGMLVRLGFALATAIRPQILLMDEWFLAGDAEFMEKARQRLEDMVRGAEILVLSTHQTFVVQELVHARAVARPGPYPRGWRARHGVGELSGPSGTAQGSSARLLTPRA